MNEIKKMLAPFAGLCPACGRRHDAAIGRVEIGKGMIERLPEMMADLGNRPFILADLHTWEAAGKKASELLAAKGVTFSSYIFQEDHLVPDEKSLGAALMHFDFACDCILAVGSGTINDLAKLLSRISGKPYLLLGTAPSMDGFASASSSMIRDGLKISLDSTGPAAILADTDILRNAPMPMLQAGLGDMIAKYTSLCEWRISALINDEYYCPAIADFVRTCVRDCVENVEGLAAREEKAVEAVTRGLILSGAAMTMAGCSRPASGIEHYFSHIWDMRGQEFGAPHDLHGIQCGTAELLSARIYERILKIRPDRDKALAYADRFRFDHWKTDLRAFLGRSSEAMIAQEERDGKYDKAAHRDRLERILSGWDTICQIIREEVPSAETIEEILKKTGAPVSAEALGHTGEEVRTAFYMTKDVRNKYIGSRLLWDLGLLEEIGKELFPDERPVAFYTEPGIID